MCFFSIIGLRETTYLVVYLGIMQPQSEYIEACLHKTETALSYISPSVRIVHKTTALPLVCFSPKNVSQTTVLVFWVVVYVRIEWE